MASCPCGCGRRVPLTKGGAAKQYPNVLAGIQAIQQMVRESSASGIDPSPLRACKAQGERIRQSLLAHLHRVASPASHPDLLAIARSITSWNAQVMNTIAQMQEQPLTGSSSSQASPAKTSATVEGIEGQGSVGSPATKSRSTESAGPKSIDQVTDSILKVLEDPRSPVARALAAWSAAHEADIDEVLPDFLMLRGAAGWVAALVLEAALNQAPQGTAANFLEVFGASLGDDQSWVRAWAQRQELYQRVLEDESERQFWVKDFSDAPHTCAFGWAFSHALGQAGDADVVDLGAYVFHGSVAEVLSTVME